MRRSLAYLVDCVLIFSAYALSQTLLNRLLRKWSGHPGWMRNGLKLEAYTLLTISLPAWLYFSLLEHSRWQATVGGRLLGLKVETLSGERLRFSQVLGRTLVKLLPWELAHLTVNWPTPMLINPQSGELDWSRGRYRFGFNLVYGLGLVYGLVALFSPQQRSVPDWVVGSRVIRLR
jgi:uncharacterized RDD family membrane protein YckC